MSTVSPQRIDSQQQERACALLTLGASRRMAADYAGCRVMDLLCERRNNSTFAQRMMRAELGPELEILRGLMTAARDPKQWRAATWVLERLYPRRYAQRKGDSLTPDDVRRFEKRLRSALQRAIPDAVERQRVADELFGRKVDISPK